MSCQFGHETFGVPNDPTETIRFEDEVFIELRQTPRHKMKLSPGTKLYFDFLCRYHDFLGGLFFFVRLLPLENSSPKLFGHLTLSWISDKNVVMTVSWQKLLVSKPSTELHGSNDYFKSIEGIFVHGVFLHLWSPQRGGSNVKRLVVFQNIHGGFQHGNVRPQGWGNSTFAGWPNFGRLHL